MFKLSFIRYRIRTHRVILSSSRVLNARYDCLGRTLWKLRTNAPISEGRPRTTNHRHTEDGVSRFESLSSQLLALGCVHNRCQRAEGLLNLES